MASGVSDNQQTTKGSNAQSHQSPASTERSRPIGAKIMSSKGEEGSHSQEKSHNSRLGKNDAAELFRSPPMPTKSMKHRMKSRWPPMSPLSASPAIRKKIPNPQKTGVAVNAYKSMFERGGRPTAFQDIDTFLDNSRRPERRSSAPPRRWQSVPTAKPRPENINIDLGETEHTHRIRNTAQHAGLASPGGSDRSSLLSPSSESWGDSPPSRKLTDHISSLKERQAAFQNGRLPPPAFQSPHGSRNDNHSAFSASCTSLPNPKSAHKKRAPFLLQGNASLLKEDSFPFIKNTDDSTTATASLTSMPTVGSMSLTRLEKEDNAMMGSIRNSFTAMTVVVEANDSPSTDQTETMLHTDEYTTDLKNSPKTSTGATGLDRTETNTRRTNYRIRYSGPTTLPLDDIYDRFLPEQADSKMPRRISRTHSSSSALHPESDSSLRQSQQSGDSDSKSNSTLVQSGCRPSLGRGVNDDAAPSMPSRRQPTLADQDSLSAWDENLESNSNMSSMDLRRSVGSSANSSTDLVRESSEVSGSDWEGGSQSLNESIDQLIPSKTDRWGNGGGDDRPDIWITPIQSRKKERRWKVKRVWDVEQVDDAEEEQMVHPSELMDTIKELLGVPAKEEFHGSFSNLHFAVDQMVAPSTPTNPPRRGRRNSNKNGSEEQVERNHDPWHDRDNDSPPWYVKKVYDIDGALDGSEPEIRYNSIDIKKEIGLLVEEAVHVTEEEDVALSAVDESTERDGYSSCSDNYDSAPDTVPISEESSTIAESLDHRSQSSRGGNTSRQNSQTELPHLLRRPHENNSEGTGEKSAESSFPMVYHNTLSPEDADEFKAWWRSDTTERKSKRFEKIRTKYSEAKQKNQKAVKQEASTSPTLSKEKSSSPKPKSLPWKKRATQLRPNTPTEKMWWESK